MRWFLVAAFSILAWAAPPEADYQALLDHSVYLYNHGRFNEASAVLSDVLKRAEQERAQMWIGVILNNIGSVYEKEGKYFQAESLLNRSISSFTQLGHGSDPAVAPVLANLGYLYYQSGEFSRSEKLFLRAISLFKEAGRNGPELASVWNNLGSVYLAQGKTGDAQDCARNALNIWAAAEGPEGRNTAFAYSLLGAAYRRSGNREDAESCLSHALTIWQTAFGPDDPRSATAEANLGILYFDTGDFAKATPFFEHAHGIFVKSGENDYFTLGFLTTYAKLEHRLGHKKEAKDLEEELRDHQNNNAAFQASRGLVDATAFHGTDR